MAVDGARSGPRAPDPLYMLAFDHRKVLRDLYPQASTEDLVSAKTTVLDALGSLAGSVGTGSLAFLVDEEYGGPAAREARARGLYVAMPAEASRTPALELQYPEDFEERFAAYDPQSVKALVFHNPDDSRERKEQQLALLRRIGDVARAQQRDFLLEVLITPTSDQLDRGGDGRQGFRARLFPELLVRSMAEMQVAGIEPDLWKVEGLETVADSAAVAEQATTGGRDHVRCIVLGSGESSETVQRWLSNASADPRFSGFAIGRTVWHRPLEELFAGRADRDAVVAQMAATFGGLVDAFGREPSVVGADRR